MEEVGFVTDARDFLIHLNGLPTIRINDMVQNEQGVRGWVNALLKDKVEVLVLDEGDIRPGDIFKRLLDRLVVCVGDFLLGRAVNPLGVPIDGRGLLSKTRSSPSFDIDQQALGIRSRQFIKNQFDTGITLIDTLIPIGKGQRELVLGDARSGKGSFLIDLIVNQKGSGTICIYASIGKTVTEVRSLIDVLKNNNALDHTIVLAATSTDTAPLIYLAPQTAFAIAEYFQKQGRDVLLILDDLGTHAKIYREIALLGSRAPGRESYPGDIFYIHAHMLERAGFFTKEEGGGSITAIPVIELNLNDFTTFIPTNLMAMTDGHLLFRSSLYNRGQRPAIDISLSVSRIGQQTQNHVQNLLSSRVKQTLAMAMQLETVSRFSSELPPATQLILNSDKLIRAILKQEFLTRVPKEHQIMMLALVYTSFLKGKDEAFLSTHKDAIYASFDKDKYLSPLTKSVFSLKDDHELIDKLEELTPVLERITGILSK